MRRARAFGQLDIESLLKLSLRKAACSVGLAVGRFPSADSLQGHLKAFFRLTDVNCVIDVGAHKGEFYEALREIGYRGRIVSFEPVEANYEGLRRKAQGKKNWHVQKIALGSEEGTKGINIYRGSVFNSFLNSSDYSTTRFGAAVECTRSEQVRVERLDRIFDECTAGIGHPKVFQVTGLFPVTRDKDDLRVVELDCVMTRPARPQPGLV